MLAGSPRHAADLCQSLPQPPGISASVRGVTPARAPVDCSPPGSAQVAAQLLAISGRCDILVNNAGKYKPLTFERGHNQGQGPLTGGARACTACSARAAPVMHSSHYCTRSFLWSRVASEAKPTRVGGSSDDADLAITSGVQSNHASGDLLDNPWQLPML